MGLPTRQVFLAKRGQVSTLKLPVAQLHLYKGKNKGRTGKSTFTKDTKMHQNLAKEPWLIASSDKEITSAQAINIYSKRMQIE